MGVFEHSCNTPHKVMEVMAHMGVAISPNAVNYAVAKLSKNAIREIERAGRTLLVGYAFDNFDVELPTTRHGVEQSTIKQFHLTSGVLLPLTNCVSREELRWSEELWKTSQFNDRRKKQQAHDVDIEDLFRIWPNVVDGDGLEMRERFNAWIFRRDLVERGPEYFRRFRKKLGEPEVLEGIPLTQTKQVPLYAMDVANSTVVGNIPISEHVVCTGL